VFLSLYFRIKSKGIKNIINYVIYNIRIKFSCKITRMLFYVFKTRDHEYFYKQLSHIDFSKGIKSSYGLYLLSRIYFRIGNTSDATLYMKKYLENKTKKSYDTILKSLSEKLLFSEIIYSYDGGTTNLGVFIIKPKDKTEKYFGKITFKKRFSRITKKNNKYLLKNIIFSDTYHFICPSRIDTIYLKSSKIKVEIFNYIQGKKLQSQNIDSTIQAIKELNSFRLNNLKIKQRYISGEKYYKKNIVLLKIQELKRKVQKINDNTRKKSILQYLNYFEFLIVERNIHKLLDWKKHYKLSHNDLGLGNVSIHKDKVVLFDWDNIGLGLQKIDLADLLSEFYLDYSELKKKFINKIDFTKLEKQVKIFLLFRIQEKYINFYFRKKISLKQLFENSVGILLSTKDIIEV